MHTEVVLGKKQWLFHIDLISFRSSLGNWSIPWTLLGPIVEQSLATIIRIDFLLAAAGTSTHFGPVILSHDFEFFHLYSMEQLFHFTAVTTFAAEQPLSRHWSKSTVEHISDFWNSGGGHWIC